MDQRARRLEALASGAETAQRSLERTIAEVDGVWRDSARQGFEGDHLAAIRSDAKHLSSELKEIARLAATAARATDRSWC